MFDSQIFALLSFQGGGKPKMLEMINKTQY